MCISRRKVVFLFMLLFFVAMVGSGFCDGTIATAPAKGSGRLSSPENRAYLALEIIPEVIQTSNQLHVKMHINKTIEITGRGDIVGPLKVNAELEAMNLVQGIVLGGPRGYREVADGAAEHTFILPESADLIQGRFQLTLRTKFFKTSRNFVFHMTVPLTTGQPKIRFVDNNLNQIDFVTVRIGFRIEVEFDDPQDDDEIEVVLKNINNNREVDIPCFRRGDGRIYRSGVIHDEVSEGLAAKAAEVLEAGHEGATARVPVSLRWVKVFEADARFVIDNATLTKIGAIAPIAYNAPEHSFDISTVPPADLPTGSHRMRISMVDCDDLDFTLNVTNKRVITPVTGGRRNFEVIGSTLNTYLDSSKEGIYVRFIYYNRNTRANEALPEGIKIHLMNYNNIGSTEIQEFTMSTPTGDLIRSNKLWENGDDLYFLVDMEHENPDVQVQYGPAETDVEWSTKENQPANGYFENFEGNHIGLPNAPIEYIIAEDDKDNNNWSNDACFIIKTIKEVHQWYVTRLTEPWNGVDDLDAEIGVAFGSWAPPTTNTIALDDKNNAQWNRGTIAHEYSHQVMYELSKNPKVLDAAYAWITGELLGHFYTKETNPDTAFLEGWAEFVQWAFTFAPANCDIFWRADDNNGTNNSGEDVEGGVANALFEINNHVVAGNPRLFTDIFWNTLREGPEDVKEFQDLVMAIGSLTAAQRQRIKDFLQNNGIVYSRLKLTKYSDTSGDLKDFDNTIPQFRQNSRRPLVAEEMSAWELMTFSLERDVSNTDEVTRGHFEVLMTKLWHAADMATVNGDIFLPWNQFAVVNKNDDGEFVANLNPAALGLTPGFYAVRVRAETSFGTEDNFRPELPVPDASRLNTAEWHNDLGVIRVIEVVP